MTQFRLKLLALVAMFLDHTAKTVLATGILVPLVGVEMNRAIIVWMTVLGRMAFPIFAWFTAEACRRTSDPKKHLLRLLVFAVISEIPFHLAFRSGKPWRPDDVLFTMLLAAAAIYLGDALTKRGLPELPCRILPAAAAIALGWIWYTDYNAWGVALILGLYYLPRNRVLFLILWSTLFRLIWHSWNGTTLTWLLGGSLEPLNWLSMLCAAGLLATYQGERGRKCRWFFYWFYPCHLMALWGIAASIKYLQA